MPADIVGDQIELRGLRVLAFCGVLPEEQARRQPFSLDIDLHVDLAPAGRNDNLTDTVDYGDVCDRVQRLAADGRFSLMERFAAVIADELLGIDGVSGVEVSVTKVRPPVGVDLATSGVRIRRGVSDEAGKPSAGSR